MKKLWNEVKARGEGIGLPFVIIGFSVVLAAGGLTAAALPIGASVLSVGLAILSVGLGFTAIGMSAKSDKRQTNLLHMVRWDIQRLPTLFNGDILTKSGQEVAKVAKEGIEAQSKEAAQKRLDEDTQKVGWVRGELFQNEDGSWAIAWGGKYPL